MANDSLKRKGKRTRFISGGPKIRVGGEDNQVLRVRSLRKKNPVLETHCDLASMGVGEDQKRM